MIAVSATDGTYSQRSPTTRVLASSATHSINVPNAVLENYAWWFDVRLRCARCFIDYFEIDNFRKACSYHPFPRDVNGEHLCCGERTILQRFGEFRGCVRCDHSTQADWQASVDIGTRNNSSAAVVTAVPDCLLEFMNCDPQSLDTLAHVDSFEQEQQPLNRLFTRPFLAPHPREDYLTARLHIPTVCWPSSAASIASIAALNDPLRYEALQVDFYTPVRKEFVSYSLVRRADEPTEPTAKKTAR